MAFKGDKVKTCREYWFASRIGSLKENGQDHPQDGRCGRINVFKSIYTANMETVQAPMAMKKSIHSFAF